MSDSNPSKPEIPAQKNIFERSIMVQCCRWLTRWSTLRPVVFSLGPLLILICSLYAFENWRGKRAWEQYRGKLMAEGKAVDYQSFLPKGVPSNENFATTPFLRPLLAIRFSRNAGETRWVDEKGKNAAMAFGQRLMFSQFADGGWARGEETDLVQWYLDFIQAPKYQKSAAGSEKAANAPSEVTRRMAAVAALDALQEFRPVIRELKEASGRRYSQFPVKLNTANPFNILLPHLQAVRKVCQVVALSASANLELEKTGEAFDDLKLLFALTDSLAMDPFIDSQMARVICQQITCQIVWEGLAQRRWTEGQLIEVERRLAGLDMLGHFARAVEAEQAFTCHYIEHLRNLPSLGEELSALSDADEGEATDHRLENLIFRMVPDGWFYLEQLNLARAYQETVLPLVRARGRIDPKAGVAFMERLEDEGRSSTWTLLRRHRVLTRLLVPAIQRIHCRGAYSHTVVELARLSCTLERFRQHEGTYPDKLGALVPQYIKDIPHDVMSGFHVKYQHSKDGSYLIYSVGWDGLDSGGKAAFKALKQVDPEKGDWIWRGGAVSPEGTAPKRAETAGTSPG